MFKSRLGFKIIIIVLTASVSTFFLVGYITFFFSKLTLEKTAIERYTQLTSETVSHIDKYLFERESSLDILAKSHTPKHFLTELHDDGTTLAHPISGVIEDLDSFGVGFSVWDLVLLVDINSVIQVSSKPDLIGKKFDGLNKLDFEKILQGESYISDFTYNPGTENISKMYVLPVSIFGLEDDESGYIGAVVAYLPITRIEEIALSIKHQIPASLWDVTGVSLLSSEGLVLFSDGSSAYTEGKNVEGAYVLSKKHTDVMGQYTGVTGQMSGKDVSVFHQNSHTQSGFSRYEGTLSLELDTNELYKPIFDIAFKPVLYVIPIIAFVYIVVFVWLFIIIIKPIRSYIATIGSIKNGNFTDRAKIYADDEIGQMAKNFNELTDQLQKSNSVLEQQVQSRTRELEIANSGLEEQVQARTEELKNVNDSLERRVAERTKELEKLSYSLENTVAERTKELNDTINELKSSNKIMVGRELKMVELKEEIKKCNEGK